MRELKDCYDKVCSRLEGKSEPFESVKLVEEYRQYWKPHTVEIILLAESHVFTSDENRSIQLISGIPELVSLDNYPNNYARFVYCLAYGEKELTNDSKHPTRDGIPQFWKLLFSCVNDITSPNDFIPIVKKKTNFRGTLSKKIDTLQTLKSQGIWLVDASIVALYPKVNSLSNFKLAIKTSWNNYTRHVVEEAKPKRIICIGKGVRNLLENDLINFLGNSDNWYDIEQPNARLNSHKQFHNYQKLGQICLG